jgi:hypothetical protein
MLKAFAAATSLSVLTAAADAPKDAPGPNVTPVFSELLRLSYPSEFHPAFENRTGNFYTRESVLQGETVERWTQMLTVSGTQGLALNPQVTPDRFVERLARGYRTHCPESFSQTPLAAEPVPGYDSYGAILACGSVADPDGPHSEVSLVVAFHGQRDYYTIQWAERGAPATGGAQSVPAPPWLARLQRLAPIRLCPKVEGEGPPYVSCANAAGPPTPAPATSEPNH